MATVKAHYAESPDSGDLHIEASMANEVRIRVGGEDQYYNVAELLEAVLAVCWISQPEQVREVLSKARLGARSYSEPPGQSAHFMSVNESPGAHAPEEEKR